MFLCVENQIWIALLANNFTILNVAKHSSFYLFLITCLIFLIFYFFGVDDLIITFKYINGHIKECFQCAKILLYVSLFKYNVYSKMTSNATFNDTCAWPWRTITFQPAELLLSPLSLK